MAIFNPARVLSAKIVIVQQLKLKLFRPRVLRSIASVAEMSRVLYVAFTGSPEPPAKPVRVALVKLPWLS